MSAQLHGRCDRALRLGFVGLGWIGRKRLNAVAALDGIEVAGLVDTQPARLAAASASYPTAEAGCDLASLCSKDAALDGVVIATPNSCHVEQVLMCLDRGIPVFCQKPLATNAADTLRIVAAARTADCLLGVDYVYRHVKGMDVLRQRLRTRSFGTIESIDLKFHNAYGPDKPWCFDRTLAGGGCLLDLGVHLLDLLNWLEPGLELEFEGAFLFAGGRAMQSGTDPARDVEDFTIANFRRSDGAAVRLACSWHAHAGRDAAIGCEIFGSGGGASWRNVNGSFYQFELDVHHGRTVERIADGADDWGSRALEEWIYALRAGAAYDPSAAVSIAVAKQVDAIYAHAGIGACS